MHVVVARISIDMPDMLQGKRSQIEDDRICLGGCDPETSGRNQILHHRAAPLSFENVPPAWRQTPILHIAPIAQELAPDLSPEFSASLLGITPQGWLRIWDDEGRVRPTEWEQAEAVLGPVWYRRALAFASWRPQIVRGGLVPVLYALGTPATASPWLGS